MAFELDRNDAFCSSLKTAVLGSGKAGRSASARLAESGLGDVSVIALETEANERLEKLSRELEGVSILFVMEDMGEDNDRSAAFKAAETAKEKGILTIAVVTKAFGCKDTEKTSRAEEDIDELKNRADAVIVIPNGDAQAKSAELMCEAVRGVVELLRKDGFVNIDLADLTRVLKNSGTARIAMAKGNGGGIADALGKLIESPMLENSFGSARRGLVGVAVSEGFTLDGYDKIVSAVTDRFAPDAEFKMGLVFDPALADDEISLIAVAADMAG